MPRIELSRLQKIIREELLVLKEGAEQDAGSKQMAVATKLLKSIEEFKKAASAKSNAEFGSSLDDVEKIVKRIIDAPMKYVDATEPPESSENRISLRPQKS